MIGTELAAKLRGGPKLSCDACGHLERRGKPPAKHIKKNGLWQALSAGSPFMAPQTTKRAACLAKHEVGRPTHHARHRRRGGGRAQRGSMMALTVQTFAPNVYLLVLLALLDRLVLSPMITQRLGPKAARRDDR